LFPIAVDNKKTMWQRYDNNWWLREVVAACDLTRRRIEAAAGLPSQTARQMLSASDVGVAPAGESVPMGAARKKSWAMRKGAWIVPCL
jgi:hypothetical protein